MRDPKRQYVICLRNDGAEDLRVRKLYEVLHDAASAERGHLRVVDESGEDYLYPEDLFALVEVSEETERALTAQSAAVR